MSRSTAAATGATAKIDGLVLDKACVRFYAETRLERRGAAAAIARDRRDRLRAAEQGGAAQGTAASTRSITTTASRPGSCAATGRSRMSRCRKASRRFCAFVVAVASDGAAAAERKRSYGIGRAATAPGDRRLGHRCAAGRAGASARQGLGQGRARPSTWPSARPAMASSAKAPGAGRRSRAARARSASDDPIKTVGSYFRASVDACSTTFATPCRSAMRSR